MDCKESTVEYDMISIIMPVYNAERYLRESIQSVINQTYTHWELIVVDDGSQDDSHQILSDFAEIDKRILPIFNKKNSGVAAARNCGIEKATGRFIAFLDSDDIWSKEKLQKQLLFMKEKGYAFTYTSYVLIDTAGNLLNKKVDAPLTITYQQALTKTAIWTSTVMIDRRIFSVLKMPLLKYGAEDSATWLSLLKKIPCAYGIQEVLSFYRQVPGSLSHNLKARIVRQWFLYREIEKMNLLQAVCAYVKYVGYVLTKRRIY